MEIVLFLNLFLSSLCLIMTVERSKRRFLIPLVFITKCFKKPLLLRIKFKFCIIKWQSEAWWWFLLGWCYHTRVPAILLVFEKIYSCLFIPNCTRNHLITYTNITLWSKQQRLLTCRIRISRPSSPHRTLQWPRMCTIYKMKHKVSQQHGNRNIEAF